jgi:ATPase subunit of ABC transporter with duplicated ATPase domains
VLYLDVFSKKVEQYDGDYNTVKKEIADRIRKENMDNARLIKAAQAKKEQAGSFANKVTSLISVNFGSFNAYSESQGGQMRKVAQKMREVAAQLESEVVDVRREDTSLKNFVIPFSQNNDVKGSGSTLMTISEVVLPGVTHQSLPLTGGPVLLQAGMHVRIRGPNGVGKTTLLESIAHNRLAGVTISPKVKIGYYRQDFDNLDFDATVIEQLQRASNGRMPEQELRKMSGAFFLGPLANQKIVTLSEGQKGLVALCSLVLQEPGVLIMDEPTNHINFRHLPALAKALSNYQGALLLVSHDADFVKKVRIDQEIDLEWELKQHSSVKGGGSSSKGTKKGK